MRTKHLLGLAALLTLAGMIACSCASVIDIRMPDEFAKKKLKEDAPPDATLINNDLGQPTPEPKH